MLARGRQRALVEPNLRVGQVEVVDEQEVGPALADEILYGGGFLDDIELDAAAEMQSIGLPIVKTDRQPVRPDGREFKRCLLFDRERGDRLALRRRQRPKRIEAGRLQPELRPG